MDLTGYLSETELLVADYVRHCLDTVGIMPEHLREGALTYVGRSAKRLRPALLMLCCGATGGSGRALESLPAAVAVELFHTWTLVHDDIIDEDELRRNEPTVHKLIETRALEENSIDPGKLEKYGASIAILAGDVLHGLSVSAFLDCARNGKVSPDLIFALIRRLETTTLFDLLHGEAIDVQLGYQDLRDGRAGVDDWMVLEMIRLKTGALFEFSGMAGAMIGKNTADFRDPDVEAVRDFAKNCGVAFQLQDDLLGLLGNRSDLGKPIGSDIREGKKTTIVLESLRNASPGQKEQIFSVLGNKRCTDGDAERLTALFGELGGVAHTKELAAGYMRKAFSCLEKLPESEYKGLLESWADIMTNREH